MDLLIENAAIVPMTGGAEHYFTGSIGIRGSKIAMIARADKPEEHARQVDAFVAQAGGGLRRIGAAGMAVMPGMVNTHNHAAMSLMRGYADDVPLMRWLHDYIWPFEAGLTPEAVRLGTELAIAEMLCGGTTTFADMYWMEASVARAVAGSGIRAVLCPTFTDANFDTFLQDAEAVAALRDDHKGGRIGMMIAPHAPYSCSEHHLRRAAELAAKYDTWLYTHVSETLDEVEQMRARYGCTSVEYLLGCGFFSRPAAAVHCVHVTEGDMDILKAHGVTVAHNPQSNMKLGSGSAPVARMLEKGLTVGLGTDGPCSNNDLDMWEEMRSAAFQQKLVTADPLVLPAYEALRMATVEGARTLGLDDRIGTLEEGKRADLLLIDMQRPHLQPVHDLVANLAYCAKASDVALTIVDGVVVAENGRCLTLDVPHIMADTQAYIESRK